MKLKAVLILGPDQNLTNDQWLKVKDLYSHEGYLIIGDGKNYLTSDDIALLNGNIDSNTRIDIFAHGVVSKDSHYLGLFDFNITTKNFLSVLNLIANKDPLYIHLWSCYSGFAQSDVSVLPEGSVLISHAAVEKILGELVLYSVEYMMQSRHQQTGYLSPLQEILNNIVADLVLPQSLSVVVNGEIRQFQFNTNASQLFSNPELLISKNIQDFIKFCEEVLEGKIKSNNVALTNLEDYKLEAPTVTQEQYENLKTGYLIYHSYVGNLDINGLNSLPDAKELFKNSINKLLKDITALFVAAQEGYIQVVEFLLASGADPNLKSYKGSAPLFAAAQNGHKEIAEILLANGAAIDAIGKDGATSLYIAAQEGRIQVVEFLLVSGADSNIPTKNGNTALFIASQQDHEAIVGLLLAKNANVNSADNEGNTALHAACINGHEKIVLLLLSKNANLHIDNVEGITPLYMAAQGGHNKVTEILLANNANPNVKDNKGITPLYMAAQNGHKETVKLLLKHKADPNLAQQQANKDIDGYGTELLVASIKGYKEIVELLLKCGAEANIKIGGYDISSLAKFNGHFDISNLIQDFLSGEVSYLPEECPSHPGYVEGNVNLDVMGEVY